MDKHGNVIAREGCDRCPCGAKYWEKDVCVSCGEPISRNAYRYFLMADWQNDWTEVSKDAFVRAERAAGFRNTMGQPDEPATAGFSGRGVSGKVELA